MRMSSSLKLNPLNRLRLDSRLLLRCLIAINILLAVYNIIIFSSHPRNAESNPCVVLINNQKDSQNVQKSIEKSESQSKLSDSEEKRFQLIEQNNRIIINQNLNVENSQLNEKKTNDNNKEAIWWSTETRGSYSVLKNYIISDSKPDYNRSLTLTTQGTFEYLYHIESLCIRFDGHISVGVYSPGDDFKLVLNLIYYLRQCKNSCVKTNTSWHLVYDTAFGPESNTSFPYSFVNDMNFNCSQSFDSIVDKFSITFRRDHSLPYPINVVRNVARINARTKYVFASDIELYPSVGIVSKFFQLLEREKSGNVPELLMSNNPHVYVIPIFEVKEGIDPPFDKSELRQLFKSGDAIFFHKWICDVCQRFPNRDKWINVNPVDNTMGVFGVTKRNNNNWEPLYIGTNSEPLYDERLTWDGKRDKMTQMTEMCLMNYDLVILDNAFLVHAPGIKHIDREEEKRRSPFVERNKLIHLKNLSMLKKKYKNVNNC